MALQSLNSNVTRLTQRLTENFKESTRDMPILRGGAGSSAVYFEPPSAERLGEIGRLLDSRVEVERLEGMKRLIAMISKGRDMSAFFPQVVKNVATPSVEIRKLVYIYLLRYASSNPDTLLLSINTFQKDLSDPSPLIRSMSLRVLTSIRLPMIQGIVMIGLRKLAGDRNPWVRKCVAGGLVKVYDMDATTQPLLLPILSQLLLLPSPITLGSSLQAFLAICPDDLAFLHPHFRRCCALLLDADEWGQIVALEVLLRYARVMLEQPEGAGDVSPEVFAEIEAGRKAKKEVREAENGESQTEQEEEEGEDELDPDLHLLLHCALPLFQSRNPAVILAASKLFYELAPAVHGEVGQGVFVMPLLRLVDGSVRSEISAMVVEWLFANHHTRFILRSTDSVPVSLNKIVILRMLVTSKNADFLIREFKEYVRSPVAAVSEEAIRAVGYCARTQEGVRKLGLGILMKMLKSNRESSVGQAVIVLKSLIQQSVQDATTATSRQLTSRLVAQLPSITHASARGCVFWLAGQYVEQGREGVDAISAFPGLAPWAPDALRLGVKGFIGETSSTKLQILSLSAKLLTICPTAKPLNLLSKYLFTLARYDANWDVRDRARFLNALLRGVRKTAQLETSAQTGDMAGDDQEDMGGVVLRREQVKSVLLGERSVGADVDENAAGPAISRIDIGSLSAVAGKRLLGYAALPEWSDDPTDPSLRDIEEQVMTAQPASSQTPTMSRTSSIHGTRPASPVTSSLAGLPPGKSGPPSGISTAASPNTARDKASKYKDLDSFLNESEEDDSEEDSTDEDQPVQRPSASIVSRGVDKSAPGRVLGYNAKSESPDSSEDDSEDEAESEEAAALITR